MGDSHLVCPPNRMKTSLEIFIVLILSGKTGFTRRGLQFLAGGRVKIENGYTTGWTDYN